MFADRSVLDALWAANAGLRKGDYNLEIAFILMREVGVMALLISLGVYTKKSGMLTPETAVKLAEFLVALVMPTMLLSAFQREKNPALMPGFWAMLVLAAITLTLSAVAATLIFRTKGNSDDYKIARLAAALPNSGFMGIPLVLATVGENSLAYCAAMIGVFQLFMWCWAIPMLNEKMPTLKQILTTPGVIAFIAGITLFLLEIRLPAIILSFINQMSSLNTPLSLLMTGIFLADVRLRDTFCAPIVYKAVFLRNLVIPAVCVFFMYAFRLTAYFGKPFSLSFVILFSCSSAASSLLLPLKAGMDGSRASQMIAASSLFSIVTLPFVAFVAEKVL